MSTRGKPCFMHSMLHVYRPFIIHTVQFWAGRMRIPQTVAAPVLLCSPPAAASGFPLEASCTGSVAVLFRTSAIGMDDDKEGGYDPTASHKGFQAHPVKVPRNVSVRVHPPKASVPT